jgi:hypothetical protein
MTGQPATTAATHSALKSSPTLHLHIQDLVFHGFASVDRNRIGTAMERELARLFSIQGIPRSLDDPTTASLLNGGILNTASATASEPIGIQLARAIHETLTQRLPQSGADRGSGQNA